MSNPLSYLHDQICARTVQQVLPEWMLQSRLPHPGIGQCR